MAARERKTEIPTTKKEAIIIRPPNLQIIRIPIVGTAPLCIRRFATKEGLEEKQRAGSSAKNTNRTKEGRNFEQEYEQAKYVSTDGWLGINATGVRLAMISACRVAGFQMTKMKLSAFVIADGYDADQTPLIRITKGEPEMWIAPVRLADGVTSLASRPLWKPGWEATLTIEFDADQFTKTDVVNLIYRVGRQVGLCEGRHDSRKSGGMGFGTFNIKEG